jgi:hypothetical protein
MKSIKIGNLVFNKKALYLLAFCLFVNGIIIGASVAYNQENESATNVIFLMITLFMPYLILFKSFSRNIKDVASK